MQNTVADKFIKTSRERNKIGYQSESQLQSRFTSEYRLKPTLWTPYNVNAMLYNQEQRQMMIWEQRETRKAVIGGLLLLDLGIKILGRNIRKNYLRSAKTAYVVGG